MRKLRKMQAGCLYLMKGMACSNTVYYENLEHTKIFLQLANQHLKDYMKVHEYMLCKDGWVFVCRLKSAEKIKKSYAKKRERKGKSPKELPIWKIVSEQIRLFLASYVTNYNAHTGREGSLVKRPYERYYFETKREALRMIHRIRRRVVGIQQGKKMYRAKGGHYRIPKKLGKGAIYLSSKRDGRKKSGGVGGLKSLLDVVVFQPLKRKVLAKFIEKSIKHTKQTHKTPIPDF